MDTSVWLEFLKAGKASVRAEMNLLRSRGEVAMVGVVMAELLQGAQSQQELEQLTDWLTALPYLAETEETWARAGNLSFQLRRRGAAGSLLDLLIAALAIEHGCEVYTADEHFRRIPGVKLYKAGG
ncbi:MAG: PIN domain-containing protein [Chloroflexi bacterium]|nr:PIN domain-containing protein [Chloroflexota bacterium]